MNKYHAHLLRDGSNMSISGRTIEDVIKKVAECRARIFKRNGLKVTHDYSISHLNESKKVWIKDYDSSKNI